MDTLDVVDIYMSRPVAIAHLGLGDWFCRACAITDHELTHATGQHAKKIIRDRYLSDDYIGYYEALKSFNRRHEEK